MEPFTDITAYLWHRLPLIMLFVCGYFVYQLMGVSGLTDGFVGWALKKSRGRPALVLLYIIAAAAALSSFIPNTITVLTLIPLLKRLDADFAKQGATGMTTPLMCAGIYGAAIGGMGSMIGSPANAVLFAALDIFEVAGRQNVTFLNWFLWSVPLVIVFVLMAWGVAAGLGLPRSARGVVIDVRGAVSNEQCGARQRYGLRLFTIYMIYWVAEAVAVENLAWFAAIEPIAAIFFGALFFYLLFVHPAPGREGSRGPLLRLPDLTRSVPRRGLFFIVVLGVLFGLVHWSGLDKRVVELAGTLLQGGMSPIFLFFVTILSVIFLTEVLSNTAVVAAFFTIAFYAAKGHGMDPLPLMIAVGVSSTCAFMTPIATTSNALAFGEMKGASLKVMLTLGCVLNLLGALLMTGWLSWVLPLVY